jgi:hypothetical protein
VLLLHHLSLHGCCLKEHSVLKEIMSEQCGRADDSTTHVSKKITHNPYYTPTNEKGIHYMSIIFDTHYLIRRYCPHNCTRTVRGGASSAYRIGHRYDTLKKPPRTHRRCTFTYRLHICTNGTTRSKPFRTYTHTMPMTSYDPVRIHCR